MSLDVVRSRIGSQNAARQRIASFSHGERCVRATANLLTTVRTGGITAVVCGACLTALSGAYDKPPTPPRNLVPITLDTTRADRLSAYGFMDAEMPCD